MKNLLACYANCRYTTKCDDLRNEILDKQEQAVTDISAYLRDRGRPPITIQVLKRGLKFSNVEDAKKAKKLAVAPVLNVTEAKIIKNAPTVADPISKKASAKSKRLKHNRATKQLSSSVKPKKAILKPNGSKRAVRIKKPRPASLLEKPRNLSRSLLSGSQTSDGRQKKVARSAIHAHQSKQRKRTEMARRIKNGLMENVGEKEFQSSPAAAGFESSTNGNSNARRATKRKRKSNSQRAKSASRNGSLFIIVEGKSANIVNEEGLMQHLLNNPSATARYFEASEVEARVQIVPKK